MRIAGIIWLDAYVDKLAAKHGVAPEEVQEVFENRPRFCRLERGNHPGEDLYAAFGESEAGRRLSVFFIHKLDGHALVISARPMDRAERKRYERRKKN